MGLVSGYGSAVLHWSIAGGAKPYTVTHGFGNGGLTTSDASAMADALYDAFVATGAPGNENQMLTGWTFLGVSVEVLFLTTIGTGSHFEAVAGALSPGSPPGALVDPYNPVVISKTTEFGGRAFRGRMYTPPVRLVYDNVDPNGVIGTSPLVNIQAAWDTYLTSINGDGDTHMVLLHSDLAAHPTPTPVESLIARNVLASQRRRKARAS